MIQQKYKQKTYNQANFILTWVLCIFSGISIGLAYLYNTWFWSLNMSLPLLFLFMMIAFIAQGRWQTHLLGAVSLATFVWLFSYELNFAVESYSFFFLGVALLVLYQSASVVFLYTLCAVAPHLYLYYQKIQPNKNSMELVLLGALPVLLMLVVGIISAGIAYWLGHLSFQKYQEVTNAETKIKSLETSMNWIMQISEGELDNMSDQMLYGIMGGSRLIEMKNKLTQARALEEKENFMNLGLARISEVISNHDYDLEELATDVLREVIGYFEAQQGTVYLLEDTEKGEMLCLKYAYACNPEKYNRHILLPDEGFIGQALQTKMVLQMEGVPHPFFQITSGLGGIEPKAIYAIPIQTNEEMVGVMEIATLHPLEPYKIDLLEKIAENVATSILSINFNNTTSQLLAESNELTIRLQNQEVQIKKHLEDSEKEINALKSRLAKYEPV